jgi:hypothetical protein
MSSSSERIAGSDLAGYVRYLQLSRQPADQFLRACVELAADMLEQHRPVFQALVDALLERGTLHRA